MLRDFHLADFFTLGNAACGVGGVLFAMLYMQTQLPFHFFAAAALAFAAGMQGGWDAAALMYFVCCGVSRLARYNVTAETLTADSGKVRYFEGTPIPTSVLLTALLAFAAWQGRVGSSNLYGGAWVLGPWLLHPMALLFVL